MATNVVIARESAMARVTILEDQDAVVDRAVTRFAEAITQGQAEHDIVDVVLAGGSTPQAAYRRISREWPRLSVDWARVRLWLGDERIVARLDPLSNGGMIRRELLDPGGLHRLPISPDRIHFPISNASDHLREPKVLAERYSEDLLSTVNHDQRGRPVVDVLLAGIGPDGHTLSIFPRGSAMDALAGHVVAVPAPTHIAPHVPRITLTGRWVDQSRTVLVMATGESKADVVGRIFGGPREPRSLPAQLLLRRNVEWLLDRPAAARLPETILRQASSAGTSD